MNAHREGRSEPPFYPKDIAWQWDIEGAGYSPKVVESLGRNLGATEVRVDFPQNMTPFCSGRRVTECKQS